MNQKEIVLIDDREYGLRQIRNAIPETKKVLYKVTYYQSFKDYQSRHLTKPYIVLLDFFLNNDGVYGHKIVNDIDAEIIIGFSSNIKSSKVIAESIRQTSNGDEQGRRAYAIQKLKHADRNPELENLFFNLL